MTVACPETAKDYFGRRSTMKLAGFATLAVALPVAAAFGWNVGGGEKEVSLKVCRPFELGTETFW